MISLLRLIEAATLPSLRTDEKEKVIDRVKKDTDRRLEKRKGIALMYGRDKLLGKTPSGSEIK
jgi:hypothetical protein